MNERYRKHSTFKRSFYFFDLGTSVRDWLLYLFFLFIALHQLHSSHRLWTKKFLVNSSEHCQDFLKKPLFTKWFTGESGDNQRLNDCWWVVLMSSYCALHIPFISLSFRAQSSSSAYKLKTVQRPISLPLICGCEFL